jgi:hypothetical protein
LRDFRHGKRVVGERIEYLNDMKNHSVKLILSFCLLPLLTVTLPKARAQESNAVVSQQYDIQIEKGDLLIEPQKNRVDVKAVWGAVNSYSVPATVGNLAKYLQAADTNLNLVLSPGAKETKIGDFKFRSGDMGALMQVLYVATEGTVRGQTLPGKNNWSIVESSGSHASHRAVEVFNLSGYIRTLGNPGEGLVREKLDDIEKLTRVTFYDLYKRDIENPNFRYHPGTSLLIVTGDSDYVEVARKIINALPGQQKFAREDLLDISPTPNQK